MGRNITTSRSRHLDTQLFNVVGPSYVPDRHGEFDRPNPWQAEPRAAGDSWRWLGVYRLAVLIVLASNLVYVGTIVHAAARNVRSAPVVQVSPIAPSIAIFGGNEPIRW